MSSPRPSFVLDADTGLIGVGRIGRDADVRAALTDSATTGQPDLSVDATSLAELVAAVCGAQSRLSDDLLLHAAALVEPGGSTAVLLSGPSMAGKSTLTAWLVQNGWGYLTDELVRVRPSGKITAWRKPISLRPSSHDLLGYEGPAITSASSLGAVAEGEVSVGAVVLLDTHSTGVAPLSSAEAAARLMQEATRFDGGDHLHALATAVQGATAIRLGRAPLSQQEQILHRVLSRERPHRSNAADPDQISGARLKQEVTAVLLGNEVVAYNEHSRRVAVLDLRALPNLPEQLPLSALEMLDPSDVSRTR